MSHEDRLVDLRLPEPRSLVCGEKYFDCDVFSPPLGEPNFAVAPLPDGAIHLNLFGNRSLHLQTREKKFYPTRALKPGRINLTQEPKAIK